MSLAAIDLNTPYPGRKFGKPHGSHLDDLSATSSCICLCWSCQHKFDHTAHHYYKEQRFPFVMGECDACKRGHAQCAFYVHTSLLTDPGRRTTHPQSWSPA